MTSQLSNFNLGTPRLLDYSQSYCARHPLRLSLVNAPSITPIQSTSRYTARTLKKNPPQDRNKTKMAEPQPQKLKEGATGGDVEDEVQDTAKSAEDRKAAAAMASMDTNGGGDDAGSSAVDKEAASKAMKSLGGAGAVAEAGADNKKVKVDAADVALLVRLFAYIFCWLARSPRRRKGVLVQVRLLTIADEQKYIGRPARPYQTQGDSPAQGKRRRRDQGDEGTHRRIMSQLSRTANF